MAIYYGDANGKAQEVIVVGKPGPQGPAGPQGAPGPQGPAGQGVPTGGTAGQVLTKKTASDYDAEWETVPSKRTCRFVVGTSTAGWTEADCDYLCDGTADDVEINAAIQALPATGGEIVILDGTYHITATIRMNKDNVTLAGNGAATILLRSANVDVIYLTSVTHCNVRNLKIDGNKTAYTTDNACIYLSSSSNNAITRNICNNSGYGIYVPYHNNNNTIMGNACNNNQNGMYLDSSGNNTVAGNTCNDNSNNGIEMGTSGSNNTVTGNTCNNNKIGMNLRSSSNNAITGNTCNNNSSHGITLSSSSNNAITGNTCNNNSSYGITLFSSSNNAITGNTCNNNSSHGITLFSSSNNNTITGNTCIRGTGQPSDYTSSQETIQTFTNSSNNLIVGNNIMGKNYVESSTGNTWINNKYQ